MRECTSLVTRKETYESFATENAYSSNSGVSCRASSKSTRSTCGLRTTKSKHNASRRISSFSRIAFWLSSRSYASFNFLPLWSEGSDIVPDCRLQCPLSSYPTPWNRILWLRPSTYAHILLSSLQEIYMQQQHPTSIKS